MKKDYITPAIKIVDISSRNLLAGSNINTGNKVDTGNNDYIPFNPDPWEGEID